MHFWGNWAWKVFENSLNLMFKKAWELWILFLLAASFHSPCFFCFNAAQSVILALSSRGLRCKNVMSAFFLFKDVNSFVVCQITNDVAPFFISKVKKNKLWNDKNSISFFKYSLLLRSRLLSNTVHSQLKTNSMAVTRKAWIHEMD